MQRARAAYLSHGAVVVAVVVDQEEEDSSASSKSAQPSQTYGTQYAPTDLLAHCHACGFDADKLPCWNMKQMKWTAEITHVQGAFCL